MTLKYLVTGATGGLGSGVLKYLVSNLPKDQFAAASSREESRKQFEDQGIAFRVVNYDDPESLKASFKDVENLFFVSTNTFDHEKRGRQHQNFVDAAEEMKVQHVWYTSLAFNGFEPNSKADVQVAHLMTEGMMKQSKVNYTSIREGLYTEAFPLLMGWYPTTSTVTLPSDGPVAFTLRSELSEATARLMIRGGYDRQIVVLNAQQSITFAEIVDVINETTGRQVQFEIVSAERYLEVKEIDEGNKPVSFFNMFLSWYDAIKDGELGVIDPLMEDVLGRAPVSPKDAIRQLLEEDRDFKWHQNYA